MNNREIMLGAIARCKARMEYGRDHSNGRDLQILCDCAEALLAEADKLESLGGWQAPAGWKLVPIEPNWDMRNEGREFLIDGLEKEPEKLAYFLWKTMINVAPLPQESKA